MATDLVAWAIETKRITPGREAHWRMAMQANPSSANALLRSLVPGLADPTLRDEMGKALPQRGPTDVTVTTTSRGGTAYWFTGAAPDNPDDTREHT